MNTMKISARLRTALEANLGELVLNAIQSHIEDVNTQQFDPRADWEITAVLELSEMAHRLDTYAEGLDTTNPLKIETMRLSKAIMTNFTAVYDVAMERLNPQPCPYAAMLNG